MFQNKGCLSISFLVLLSFLIIIPENSKAEDLELLHLIVLADISGSLDTEDTNELQALITRIPRFLDNEKLKQSKLSVVAFASEAEQICDTSTIAELQLNAEGYESCLEKIQASKRNNPNINKRAKNVGIDTNQVKAFQKGLEIASVDSENYIPVFLLLTDGALDPAGTGENSQDSINEFEKGFLEVRPEMQEGYVQLFVFGFGDAILEDLTKWSEFSAQRRSCQEEAPERIYKSNGDIFPLLININTAMNQVTCGEAKALITLAPGEPRDYYVSDLVEKLNIKIDLKGTSGIDAEVLDPSGNLLGSMLEDSTSGECVNTYIVCYEIVNPEPGNWKLSSQLFSSEAQTASIIVADISQYGTFSLTTNCEINTLRNGFEVCSFELVPTRIGAKDLPSAIETVTFDFLLNSFDVQERGSFYQDSLSIQLFRGLTIGKGTFSIQINPIYSEFDLKDGYKWLQFIQKDVPEFVLEPLVTDTTVVNETEELVETEETFPWLLLLIGLIIMAIISYLASRKQDLPSGTVSYGLKNSSDKTDLVFYGGSTKAYFEIKKTDSGLVVDEGDKNSVELMTLESTDRKGIKFWENKAARNFELTFEGENVKSFDEIEIEVYEEFVFIFTPDESEDIYGSYDEDEDSDEYKFD
jgi:uncharacterized protein YegL